MFDWLFGRRSKILAEPFPAEWEAILATNCLHDRSLPPPQKKTLRDAVKILVAERSWTGCNGLEMTDEVKITIAAQAALLLLGGDGYFFERVPSILVYPGVFVRPERFGTSGVLVDEERELLGEAWKGGAIVLSWPNVLQGGQRSGGQQNLVVHEFAHHLDGLDGEMGGTPPLGSRQLQSRWDDVIQAEFQRLTSDVSHGRETLLDAYGTTNQAEFFAVTSECFIERPRALREQHRELFELLRDFYRFDPTALWPDIGQAAPQRRVKAARKPQPVRLPKTVDDHYTLAYSAYEDGDVAEAISHLNLVLEQQPDDDEALLLRARCTYAHDDLASASADVARVLQLNPTNEDAQILQGLLFVESQRPQEACQILAGPASHKEAEIETVFLYGLALAQSQRFSEALEQYNRVLRANPNEAEAYFERGLVYQALGKEAEAAVDLERAKHSMPEMFEE